MWYTQCDENIVQVLVRLLSRSLANGAQSEAEDLLEALRVLRPSLVQLDFYEAQLLIRRQDWVGALHLLRQIEADKGPSALCSALQAWCLHHLRDPEWRIHVSTLLATPNPVAMTVVSRFLKLPQLPGTLSADEKLSALCTGIAQSLNQAAI
ncbi:hypothetical protein CY652_19680 [Burkholderia sp. WAC0059]|uniref:HrpB1 family type III secretion system apparatus protein n=1 Tax=Burkholderia sp. WAC0059 TaxID=2066022 RepID=UPI000C7EA2AF|nr:HrpB1 family type III secretion system apparatus protein [Burkholderia sp. WAC0059]PLZ00686.1 hypothetical protein CY652_19680 [Burkholderia sp. WAC0059]